MSIIKEDDLLKTKDFPLYLSFDKEVWNIDDSEEMLETITDSKSDTNKDANTDTNTNLI